MKNPKEKAEHLLELFNLPTGMMSDEVKKCALICVQQIIKNYTDNICERGYDNDWDMWEAQRDYWVKVKEEIIKL